MGRRRTGRELALQLAYGLDQGGLGVSQVDDLLERLPVLDDEEAFAPSEGGEPDEAAAPERYFRGSDWRKVREFASWLVRGAWEKLAEVDAAIQARAERWKPERMPVIDRNVLRLAVWELLFAVDPVEEIPPKATINEWIEVGKKYSTEQSGAFINGILDRISRELRPARGGPAGGKRG